MEPPPKRPRIHDPPADSRNEVGNDAPNIARCSQSSTTFDGAGISNSLGNFGVGRDVNFTTNHYLHTQVDKEDAKEREKKRLLDSLFFHQIDTRRQTIKNAYPKTCRWFLQTDVFKQWEERGSSDHNKFLWIRGKPGAGKSTLMKFLYRYFSQPAIGTARQENLVSFFFSARGHELERSISGMYRSLLLQLLELKPESQIILDQFRQGHEWTIESLRFAIEEAAKFLEGTPTICLIDALDECDQSQVRDVVSFLETLVDNQNSLHICFASRHYPHITQKGLGIILEEGKGHQQDITTYLNSALRIGDGKRAENIRSKLQDKARGVFMWVVIVVEILNKDYDAGDGRNLEKKIDQLPGDLFSLFRDILTRDTNNPKALLLCIQWILFARQPLTPTQLYLAILSGLEPESLSDCHMENDEDKNADAKRYILDKSKGLAEWTKGESSTVQFIHESVNDFLWRENGLAWLFPDLVPHIEGHSHEALKACCFAYTAFVTDFSGGESFMDVSPKEVTQAFPLLDYANSGILYHADQAGSDGIDQHGFLATFPRSEWVKHRNMLERFVTRLYTPNVTLFYILAEAGLPTLIRAHEARQSCFEIEAERHGNPILAACAMKHVAAILVMLELQAAKVPDFDFREFYSRLPPGSNQLSSSKLNFKFQSERGLLDQLIEYGNDLASLFFIITAEPYVGSAEGQQDDLLHLALQNDRPETARLLIERGSSIQKTWHGHSLLHFASSCGNAELAKLLLDRGCKISHSSYDRVTPLHMASSFDVAKLLIDLGSNIEATTTENNTPLHMAARKALVPVAEILIVSGANVSATNVRGHTPLHDACHADSVAIARLLLESGADIEAAQSDGWTPLYMACQIGSFAAAKLLIKSGADVMRTTRAGDTPLHSLARSPKRADRLARLLIDSGASVDAADQDGETPLFWAAQSHDLELFKLLLDFGADISIADNYGNTPLIKAASSGWIKIVELLLNHGVDISATNKDGETALQVASRRAWPDIVNLLCARGAD